jgi:hypothetical protein
MKPMYEIVALLEARGCTDAEIASATGYGANHIWSIRNEAEGYGAAVAEYKREIAERLISESVDVLSRFNAKVPIMTDNLEDLALRADKEGVRLKATQDWLDRAPDAPKRVQRQESFEQKSIMLGVRAVDNMKAALVDVGAGEIIDLLDGEDFKMLEEPETSNVVNVDDD